jgi:hypothetical protein
MGSCEFVLVSLIWRTSSRTYSTNLVAVEQVRGKEDTLTKDEIVGKANARSDWNQQRNYYGITSK